MRQAAFPCVRGANFACIGLLAIVIYLGNGNCIGTPSEVHTYPRAHVGFGKHDLRLGVHNRFSVTAILFSML